MEKRVCKKCCIEKPLSEYERYIKNGKIYYRWRCLDCKRAERLVHEREYRKRNSKKKSEINRKWAKKNKEKLYADRKKKRESDEVYKCAELLRTRIGKGEGVQKKRECKIRKFRENFRLHSERILQSFIKNILQQLWRILQRNARSKYRPYNSTGYS